MNQTTDWVTIVIKKQTHKKLTDLKFKIKKLSFEAVIDHLILNQK